MREPVPSARRTNSSSHHQLVGLLSILLGIAICLLMVMVISGMLLVDRARRQPVSSIGETGVPPSTPIMVAVESTATLTLPVLPPAYVATAAPGPAASWTPVTATSQPTPAPIDATATDMDCTPPEGWKLHYVLPGETLFAYVLGAGGTVSTDDLRSANCLSSDLLQINQPLYLPPGAAENAPPSEPVVAPGSVNTGPRTPACNPHCTISIRPGWRAGQIADAIDTTPVGFWGADFMAAIGSGASLPSYDFLASKPAGQSLEGFLYPGTYELSNETTAADFRDMLLAAFAANLPPDASASAAAHGMTLYDAITLASIIQRESWSYNEQVLISSVFHNRLRSGGKLGSTVTAQYWYGMSGNWWPRISGSQINTDSPYNTNIRSGLPPSPISNPGVDAIRAALSPADTNYVYFTGNCRGSGNLYAATYEEHLANVNACN